MIITTLPITPSVNPNIGTFFSPFTVDFVANLEGLKAYYAFNLIGRRHVSLQEACCKLELHAPRLEKIGITISEENSWLDSSEKSLAEIQSYVRQLYGLRILKKEKRIVAQCPCGAVEILESRLNNALQGKVLIGNKCSLCHGEVSKKTQRCLLYTPSPSKVHSSSIWASKEMASLSVAFDKVSLLVSRNRSENPEVVLGGESFFLDVDFFWSFYLCCLYERNSQDEICIVTTHRTLRQALLACWLLAQVYPSSPESRLIVLPTIEIVPARPGGLSSENSIDDFLESLDTFSQRRLFLANGLGLNQKEVALSSSLLYWVKQSIPFPNQIGKVVASIRDTAISEVNPAIVKSLMSKLRKNRTLSCIESSIFRAILRDSRTP